jgi:hypothetical protein
MRTPFESQKKPYSPPTVKELTLEQARAFVTERANCSDQEAADWLKSLRQEQENYRYERFVA